MTYPYPVSIAPMMDWTDRHYRYFMRLITRHTLLYTEMITASAILYGDRTKLLGFSAEEKPLVLQVGGDDPLKLQDCAVIAQEMGYDQINLNVGCPSDRVQNGHFGACLMAKPHTVAECISAMKSRVKIPVTVKNRIGIDDLDRYEDMRNFVSIVAEAGCEHFIIHARKAWLKGLNPKQNRTIPPLRYEDVYRLKQEFPHLIIEINGGVKTWSATQDHLQQVDAVMIGRMAYETPYQFAMVDRLFYNDPSPVLTRHQVVAKMSDYIEKMQSQGVRLNAITRHILELFAGERGTKAWKRYISENAHSPSAGVEVLKTALEWVDRNQSFVSY